MLKFIATLGLAIAFSASAAPVKKVDNEERVKDAVRRQLLDPDSAKFYGVIVSKDTGSTCGYVNAKNRMGGYSGKSLFYVTREMDVIMEPTGDRDSYDSEKAIGAIHEHMAFLKEIRKNCPEMP